MEMLANDLGSRVQGLDPRPTTIQSTACSPGKVHPLGMAELVPHETEPPITAQHHRHST